MRPTWLWSKGLYLGTTAALSWSHQGGSHMGPKNLSHADSMQKINWSCPFGKKKFWLIILKSFRALVVSGC